MKSFVNTLLDIFDSVSRARAASHFARMGRHDLAKAIMIKD
jgi:hypothetical protein